ncbi:MAG: hypothetical protein K2Q22_03950, partial [Cytophagales bacterium]|nr:hypothetical protein [Cytophagales bacterium]
MKNRFSSEFQTIVLTCLVLIFHACKSPSIIEGPELNELYGPFVIKKSLTLSTKTPNFTSNDKVGFSVELSKISEWTITITGLNSNAIKVISGKSKVIDQSNAVWNGSTTFFPRFGVEKAKIELSFKDTSLVIRDTVQITGTKVLQTGLVVTQFPASDLGTLFSNKLIDYSADGDLIGTSTTAPYKPVLGSSSLTMKGVDKNKDTYLGNVMYNYKVFNPTSTTTSSTYPVGSSDASQVYFNMAVFGVSSAPGSTMLLQFFEDCNNDGKYTE